MFAFEVFGVIFLGNLLIDGAIDIEAILEVVNCGKGKRLMPIWVVFVCAESTEAQGNCAD